MLLAATLMIGHALSRRRIGWIGEAGVALLLGAGVGLFVWSPLIDSHGTFGTFVGFSRQFFFLAILPPIIFEAGWRCVLSGMVEHGCAWWSILACPAANQWPDNPTLAPSGLPCTLGRLLGPAARPDHLLTSCSNVGTHCCLQLPPLSCWDSMNVERFFANCGAIACMAFAGTLISTAAIGLVVWAAGTAGLCSSLSWLESLLFGSIISATDPVGVLLPALRFCRRHLVCLPGSGQLTLQARGAGPPARSRGCCQCPLTSPLLRLLLLPPASAALPHNYCTCNPSMDASMPPTDSIS